LKLSREITLLPVATASRTAEDVACSKYKSWQQYIQKTQEKRCFPYNPRRVPAACGERRRYRLKIIRAIMIVAILATALSFGACAQRKETVTTSAGTTGYAK
jgi:hypothetical protein